MITRTLLAALYYKENRDRGHAEDKTGEKRYSLSFKKARGDFTLQEVKESQTFCYVQSLMQTVVQKASVSSLACTLNLPKPVPCPAPLASSFPRPAKEEAVLSRRSRYAKSTTK
ncbi:uncharacterized protein [Littorina saxatilis]|uniref:uncharacterized protein n=1 Tax=Littorina saxatilis TaxID=31220 RepID=UPI0038B5FB02